MGGVKSPSTMSIGQLARRTGLSVSAIRYYEVRGLVRATRGAGNQRRFMRSDIRRLSFALIAQQLGLTLSKIEAELATLPKGQAPTRADWRAIGTRMRGALAARFAMLQKRQGASRRLYRVRVPVARYLRLIQPERPRCARRTRATISPAWRQGIRLRERLTYGHRLIDDIVALQLLDANLQRPMT